MLSITTYPLRTFSLAGLWALFGVSALGTASLFLETLGANYNSHPLLKHAAWYGTHNAVRCKPYTCPSPFTYHYSAVRVMDVGLD